MGCVLSRYLKGISVLIVWIFLFEWISWANTTRETLAPTSVFDTESRDTSVEHKRHHDVKTATDPFASNPIGLHLSASASRASAYAIRVLAEHEPMRDFVARLLTKRYSSWGLPPDLAMRIITTLTHSKNDPAAAITSVYSFISKDPAFAAAYHRYKSETKYDTAYSQISDLLDLPNAGGVVLDIGAGDLSLTTEIAKHRTNSQVIGVDIFPQQPPTLPNIRYIYQVDPLHIKGIEDGTVDVGVMHEVLHHIPYGDTQAFLKELRRVLKPNGRIVLIEDTFSTNDSLLRDDPYIDLDATQEFKRLLEVYGVEFATRYFLPFNDWYGNHLIHRHFDMPLPNNFHSMEEWDAIFKASGFQTLYSVYTGFPAKSFHKPSIGIFVFSAEVMLPTHPLPTLLKELSTIASSL